MIVVLKCSCISSMAVVRVVVGGLAGIIVASTVVSVVAVLVASVSNMAPISQLRVVTVFVIMGVIYWVCLGCWYVFVVLICVVVVDVCALSGSRRSRWCNV